MLKHLVEALDTTMPEPTWGEEIDRLMPHPAYAIDIARDASLVDERVPARQIELAPVRPCPSVSS